VDVQLRGEQHPTQVRGRADAGIAERRFGAALSSPTC
jgi:hypothetical protein